MKPRRDCDPFKSEAELCAVFISTVDKRSWTPYPETAGFDILLSRKKDGFQIGIEAKLRLNVEVLNQALPAYKWDAVVQGPDCRAVLVPQYANGGLSKICDGLGITLISCWKPNSYRHQNFTPTLPDGNWHDDWHEWCPLQRHNLPDYIPDVTAGCSAPLQLTEWKIKAIKLAIILDERPVTRADFKALRIDPSRWTDRFTGWLNQTEAGYVRGKHCPDFKAQHPVNYEQIKADREKWMPAGVLA